MVIYCETITLEIHVLKIAIEFYKKIIYQRTKLIFLIEKLETYVYKIKKIPKRLCITIFKENCMLKIIYYCSDKNIILLIIIFYNNLLQS